MKSEVTLSNDLYLHPYLDKVKNRRQKIQNTEIRLTRKKMSIEDFAAAHEYYGLHLHNGTWVFREWAPNATGIYLIGDFNEWELRDDFKLRRINDHGDWELTIDNNSIHDQQLFKLKIFWNDGEGERIPAYARRVIQDEESKVFSAQVWLDKYEWQNDSRKSNHQFLKIYEAHIGMSSEEEKTASYDEFRREVLPRIVKAGYNTIQLMGIQEHPYYGSFGYQVSNFFAPSSRFGTPLALKQLIDEAHANGIAVIMDMVHSHAVKNVAEGLSQFDGTDYQYFHSGGRGSHTAWDSRLFDYGKPEVLHFLLSNCRYWLDEFHFDGFRFDGVTSMLYSHHGVGYTFTSYDDYFNQYVDTDAYVYLALANKVIHKVKPAAKTIAEEISGMPGLTSSLEEGGCGFDLRQAMGVTDYWFKMLKDMRDEEWNMDTLFHELTDKRPEERTISYTECHDQALVGGKTLIFELADKEMYTAMHRDAHNIIIDRAIALHKMARLATFITADSGYLNFMGNEFGHPEWIDFPREGNNWSFFYSRRQWSLRDNQELKYHGLGEFDKAMMALDEEELKKTSPTLVYSHNENKILVIRRDPYLALFNFHPETSFPDYQTPVGEKGAYKLFLDTDQPEYCGTGRLEPEQQYFACPGQQNSDVSSDHWLKVYLPSRCALLLTKQSC
ncbi:MAG: alpha-amylase family glycosyl hydrolase [Lentisphaeria bacterium]